MLDIDAVLADETAAAIRAVPGRIVQAWADNDAAAFAAMFTSDGTLILPGIFLQGREEIQGFMTQAYAGPYKGTNVTGNPIAVKHLSEGVALIITQGGVLAPGETEPAPERAIRATWTLAKQGRDWLITAYQNTPLQAS
ncbi:SgcJ/EcaC family oxidoreductase [Micromonospora sp. CPCC 205561]|uniref:SgcJ/EcaC family oxidoreductase n=1 Tax=Micromonospora sp. CPCC 205561 TaxID=3122407 RepID=UPI002FF42F5C